MVAEDEMKLLACMKCNAIFNLEQDWKACPCGETGGRYLEDSLHAEYFGNALPLAFANRPFLIAIAAAQVAQTAKAPLHPEGPDFEAWVIPWDSPRMKKIIKPDNFAL